MGEKEDAHVLFNFSVENDGQLPVIMYTKFDINLMKLKPPNVGFLILEEPNSVLDRKHHTKTSRHHRLEFDMPHLQGFHGKIWGRKF